MIEKSCIVCGSTYKVKPYKIDTAKYCSYDCFHKARRNIPMPKEQKEKISQALKGKIPKNISLLRSPEVKKKSADARRGTKQSKEWRENISKARKGIVFSEAHIENLRKSHIGYKPSALTRKRLSDAHRGSKTNFWKGGITELGILIRTSEAYREWREKVMNRDGFTCYLCGQVSGKLEVHHKRLFSLIFSEFLKANGHLDPVNDKYQLLALSGSYDEFWKTDNGITLCLSCHDTNELHKKEKAYDWSRIA